MITEQERKAALDGLNKLAMACDPSNETMGLVRAIRAALSSPRVISRYTDGNGRPLRLYPNDVSSPAIEDTILDEIKSIVPPTPGAPNRDIVADIKRLVARMPTALPKMQKVDLDELLKCDGWDFGDGYNAAIDDIKAKYGELYAEVKE